MPSEKVRKEALKGMHETIPLVIEKLPRYSHDELVDLQAKCIAESLLLAFGDDEQTAQAIDELRKLSSAINDEMNKRKNAS